MRWAPLNAAPPAAPPLVPAPTAHAPSPSTPRSDPQRTSPPPAGPPPPPRTRPRPTRCAPRLRWLLAVCQGGRGAGARRRVGGRGRPRWPCANCGRCELPLGRVWLQGGSHSAAVELRHRRGRGGQDTCRRGSARGPAREICGRHFCAPYRAPCVPRPHSPPARPAHQPCSLCRQCSTACAGDARGSAPLPAPPQRAPANHPNRRARERHGRPPRRCPGTRVPPACRRCGVQRGWSRRAAMGGALAHQWPTSPLALAFPAMQA